jgi:hypothetical protein
MIGVGERSSERGAERERGKHQKEDERKQIGTLDQFRIPYKGRGHQMASAEKNVMKRSAA